jgi:hypothetical protein
MKFQMILNDLKLSKKIRNLNQKFQQKKFIQNNINFQEKISFFFKNNSA